MSDVAGEGQVESVTPPDDDGYNRPNETANENMDFGMGKAAVLPYPMASPRSVLGTE